ncbi:hypothetical protein LCGC14_1259170 [marine sediment metagenome]|uniref:Uncharacterized protein n=1 Tax=marine sediment metagenome TaxID=412755 RepID=A0A0F9P4L7_9ZZZZ
MKKRERHLAILAQMQQNEEMSKVQNDRRAWVTSYDIARWQSVAQPHAYRLLTELYELGLVWREKRQLLLSLITEYTLSPEGREELAKKPMLAAIARETLMQYKMNRYRKGLMS